MTSPDYYLLDELLTDEARAVRDRVRAFVDSDVLPVINDYWDHAEFPWPLVPKLAGLGLAGYTIQGYGCPGLSPLALGMVTLELARGDGSITTFMSVQSGLTMGSIDLLGSEEQKQRWLPAMAALDKIGAFALTEPDHGSELRRAGDHRPPRRQLGDNERMPALATTMSSRPSEATPLSTAAVSAAWPRTSAWVAMISAPSSASFTACERP